MSFVNPSALVFVAAFLGTTAAAQSVAELFGPHLSSGAEIYYPNNAAWEADVQQRWSTWSAPTYRAAIKVATVQDIQNTVKIAGAHNISFLATSAGHGTSLTYARLHDGIDIDISEFNKTSYDAATGHFTIGGGTKFQAVWDLLQPHGKEFPTGTAPCVGALGASLGAGIGMLQGLHGLELDSLLSVKLVTATGDLVTASKTQNSDLFWALRGAGFNFGIVTEATFKSYNASYGGNVMETDMAFLASANASIFEILKSFDHDALDPKLSITLAVGFNREVDQAVLLVNAVYFGPNETLSKYIKPFVDLGPVQSQSVLTPWNELAEHLFFGNDGTGCSDNLHLIVGGQGLKQTNTADYEKFFSDFQDFNRAYPLVNASFVVERYSTKGPLAVPAGETAYPYRDIETHLLWEIVYPDTSKDQEFNDFIAKSRKNFQPGSGYSNLTVYVNYNHGDEGPEVWYSPEHLPRLSKLKAQWDPKEEFSWNAPVPLHYSKLSSY